MDDTLLDDQHNISDSNKSALAAAQDKGVQVVISTGRMYSSVEPYLEELALKGPMITYNGALVKRVADNKILYHHSIPQKTAAKIIKLAKEKDLHFNLYLNDQLYVNKLGSEAQHYKEIADVELNLIKDNLNDLLTDETTKILIVDEDTAKIEKLLKEFRALFKEQLNIFTSKPSFLEFTNQGVSKGSTLEQLARDLDVKRDEIIAIGDSYNDLEMIEYAGLGVAVANAREKIKDKADYVTASNNQSGVAAVIKKYIL